MKNKKIQGAVFVWDWNEIAPIADIVKAAKRIPKSKLWEFVDVNASFYVLIVAPTKAQAKDVYRFEVGDSTNEEDSDRIEIHNDDLCIWVDE